MAKSADAEVKRLLDLAARMGLPAPEAIRSVQELTTDLGTAPTTTGTAPPAS